MNRHKKSIVAVIEGVRAGDGWPSTVGIYGRHNLRPGLIPDERLFDLTAVPVGFETGVDPIMGETAISSVTATFVATPDLMKIIMDAQGVAAWGDPFVWTTPAPAVTSGFPGRYRADFTGPLPPFSQFHSSTTTYDIVDRGGGAYSVYSSHPLPDESVELACYAGTPQIGGRRLVICEVTQAGDVIPLWRGFIESVSLSSQQTEVEVTAVDPLRVLSGVVDDPIQASVIADRSAGTFIWSADIDLASSQVLPDGETPLPIVVRSGDVYLPMGVDKYSTVPESIHVRQSFTTPTDEDHIHDDRASVAHGYDPDGILGEAVGEAGITAPELLLRWIDHHLRQIRTNEAGVVVYDGAPWRDLIEEGDFAGLASRAPSVDHALLDATVSIDDLERWCLTPLGYFLRLTVDGRLGAARIRPLDRHDFEDVFSVDSGRPSHRAVLLPDRIDMEMDIRRGEATYVGELGGVVDGVEPDEIFVRPGRAPTDPAPRFMGSERRFDFRFYQRTEAGVSLVVDRLRDSYDLFRRAPIISAVVPLESFTPWGVEQRDAESTGWSRLPAVGEWVRLDGGPETGVVCADGRRRRLRELDIEPIGLLVEKSVSWRDMTAEIRVLMAHWDGALPRLVAPAYVIGGLSGSTILTVAEEYRDSASQLGFLIGDQVRLADRSGRYISEEVYEVAGLQQTPPWHLTLNRALTVNDQMKIHLYTNGGSMYARGAVLRLAMLDEYDNSWLPQGVDAYFLSPSSSRRIWAYWSAEPADLWSLS